MSRSNIALAAAIAVLGIAVIPISDATAQDSTTCPGALASCQRDRADLATKLLACGTELVAKKAELLTCRTNPCSQLSTGEKCPGGMHHLTAQQALEFLTAQGRSLNIQETARLIELSSDLVEEKVAAARPEQLSLLGSQLNSSKARLAVASEGVRRAEAARQKPPTARATPAE